MSEGLLTFITQWQNYMLILAPTFIVIGIAIFVLYYLLLNSKKSYKSKYDFVSKYEYIYFFAGHIAFGIAIFLICNTYKPEAVLKSFLWFFIRFFIAVCFGVLYAYTAQLLLKFYYPSIRAKKLKKYRYTPRVNPDTGNEMKLLSEDEEDAYLDEGMQAEEDVFSVDYDVWIDTETGTTQIEKYEGRLHALECDRCGFQTLKLEKEEITKEVSEDENGELIKHYKCSYCKRIKRKTVSLSNTKTEDDFSVTESTNFVDVMGTKQVVLVKVDIHSNDNETKSYEFQNLQEAQKFLREFSFKKID